jgi:hypothetical protein
MSTNKPTKKNQPLTAKQKKLAARRAAERWTLKEAAAELSERSASVHSPREWLATLKKLVPKELLQPLGGEVLADDVNALLDAHPYWRGCTPRLPSRKLELEHRAGSWEYLMDANTWWPSTTNLWV